MKLDAKIPEGPIQDKWANHKMAMKLVNPAKGKYKVIIIGSGLAGASAAATMGELGYNVDCYCFQDSPRRAHSIAAQGGINAAKNYPGDGDSIDDYSTIPSKAGTFAPAKQCLPSREISNKSSTIVLLKAYHLLEIIGLLDNRSFGGAQVSRTFYARGQTGQQLLIEPTRP